MPMNNSVMRIDNIIHPLGSSSNDATLDEEEEDPETITVMYSSDSTVSDCPLKLGAYQSHFLPHNDTFEFSSSANLKRPDESEYEDLLSHKRRKSSEPLNEINHWIKLADDGVAEAQVFVGKCLYFGVGMSKSDNDAVKWFERAASQGHAKAHTCVGFCYELGVGVDIDLFKSFQSYQKGALKGDAKAQNNLGLLYEAGKGVQVNLQKAFECYMEAAKLGCADALYNLGRFFDNGLYVTQDKSQASIYYKKAADQSHINADYLEDSRKLEMIKYQDHKEMKNLYEAACNGDLSAQVLYGTRIFKESSRDKNLAEALYWFQMAANQGSAVAQFNLGYCFESGLGVEKDLPKAFESYHNAAEQELVIAQAKLGLCYEMGIGVEKDLKLALYWYQRAAYQGNDVAQYSLGRFYMLGLSVSQNSVEATKWFTLSAEKGNECAKWELEKGPRKQNLDMVPIAPHVFRNQLSIHDQITLKQMRAEESQKSLQIRRSSIASANVGSSSYRPILPKPFMVY